jgi:hypothetical protein
MFNTVVDPPVAIDCGCAKVRAAKIGNESEITSGIEGSICGRHHTKRLA